jgi:hypothetical protein
MITLKKKNNNNSLKWVGPSIYQDVNASKKINHQNNIRN